MEDERRGEEKEKKKKLLIESRRKVMIVDLQVSAKKNWVSGEKRNREREKIRKNITISHVRRDTSYIAKFLQRKW